MNPDPAPTPREQIEMRLTALLMGEVSAEETVALHALIAADPELAKLHARLHQAMALLREATAEPEPATPTPARLSSERRERLLAHFKGIAPKPAPAAKAPRRDWSWVVPLGLAAAVVFILAGLAMQTLSRVQTRSQATHVLEDLRIIDSSISQYAIEANPWKPIADPRDTVVGQIRATDEKTSWASQPGLVRGFVNAEGTYKLDSANALDDSGSIALAIPPTPADGPAKKSGASALYLPPTTDAPASGKADPSLDGATSYGPSGATRQHPDLDNAFVGQKTLAATAARPAESPKPGGSAAPVLGDIPALGNLFSNPEVAAPQSGAKEFQRFPGDSKSGDQIVVTGGNTYDGTTTVSGGKLAFDQQAQATPKFDPGQALARHVAGAVDDRLKSLEVGEGVTGRKERMAQTPDAKNLPATPTPETSLETRDPAGEVVAFGFDGSVNYGSPIAKPAPVPTPPAKPVAQTGKDARDKGELAARPADGDKQVKIESKHVEIAQNNLEELSFAWVDDETSKLNINTASEGTGPRDVQEAQAIALAGLGKAMQENGDKEGGAKKFAEPAPSGKPASGEKSDQYYKAIDEMLLGRSEGKLKQAQKGATDADPPVALSLELRQQAAPDVLRDLAAASLKDEKIKDLLAKHGYRVAPSATPAPAPAPVAAHAEKALEMAKLESVKLAEEGKKATMDEEVLARKPAAPAAIPQPEVATSANAFSTFSLNVSDVSFKLAGASLEKGQMPELATVRSEEFINAFDYRDPEPAAGAPLAFATERARYPFAQNRDLVRLSVKTAAAGRQPGRPLNLVLLLDNSGSMERADRVRILREALRVLAAQLQPQDRLSVVSFARTPRLWADGVAGDKAGEAVARVGEITPQGGTNLAAALDLGYATALKHYQPGSISRVVLLTDGAANLGDVNPDALKQKVETNRQRGVALDCFGIGWEGYDDTLLETLARNGDGRYGFINTPEDAASGFAAQLAGALRVAASDVKVQVEWNPRRVTAYRQIGYAKHQLKKEQFRDNTVDAAEIGAAESGNALYVVEVNPRGTGDLATVRVRFKVPGTADYKEHEWTVPFTPSTPPLEQASPALRLAGTASAFSEWLTASPYAAEVTPDRLLGLLNGVPAIYPADPRPKKLEWMIRTAKSVSGR